MVVSVLSEALVLSVSGALMGALASWLLFNGMEFNGGGQLGAIGVTVGIGLPVIVVGMLWACLIGLAAAFSPNSISPNGKVLSEIDTMCIMNTAEYCLGANSDGDDACDVEDHLALVNRLDEQIALLESRVASMKQLSSRLHNQARYASNGRRSLDEKEVESLMHSIESVLSMEFESQADTAAPSKTATPVGSFNEDRW